MCVFLLFVRDMSAQTVWQYLLGYLIFLNIEYLHFHILNRYFLSSYSYLNKHLFVSSEICIKCNAVFLCWPVLSLMKLGLFVLNETRSKSINPIGHITLNISELSCTIWRCCWSFLHQGVWGEVLSLLSFYKCEIFTVLTLFPSVCLHSCFNVISCLAIPSTNWNLTHCLTWYQISRCWYICLTWFQKLAVQFKYSNFVLFRFCLISITLFRFSYV